MLINPTMLLFAALLFFGHLANATGSLNGLPILNGPIPVVPQNDPDMKRGPGDFVHPGLWHTHDDLERIRTGVKEKKEPWNSAYEAFRDNEFSQANVGLPPELNAHSHHHIPVQATDHHSSTKWLVPAQFYVVALAATIQASQRTPGQPTKTP
jgi:hypothetical protein